MPEVISEYDDKITIRLSKERKNDFKSMAAKDGSSMNELVNEWIAEYVEMKIKEFIEKNTK